MKLINKPVMVKILKNEQDFIGLMKKFVAVFKSAQ